MSLDKENCQINGDPYNDGGDQEQLVDNRAGESRNEMSQLNVEEQKKEQGVGGLKVIVVSSVVFALAVTISLIITIYLGPDQVPKTGAVASNSQICANIGITVLHDGGSTIDSVVASAFCESVVSSHLCGLGGGGFIAIRDVRKSATHTFDFHDVAPTGVENMDATQPGASSVAIPGFVAGMKKVHDLFGKLSWKTILQPTLDLARRGFNVTEPLVEALSSFDLEPSPLRDAFTDNVTNTLYGVGDVITLPALANLIENIANEGEDGFYAGDNVQHIISTVNDSNSMTADDFGSYEVVGDNKISSTFHGHTLDTPAAPSGGPGLLFFMNVVEKFGMGINDHDNDLYYHRMIEASRFTSAEFTQLGDPSSDEVTVNNITDAMISADFASSVHSQILDNTTHSGTEHYEQFLVNPSSPAVTPPGGTSGVLITAIGTDDFIISLTISLGGLFGSKLMTSDGVILNNHLNDFNSQSSSNVAAVGKRPQSTLTPVIVYHSDKPCGLRLASGGASGDSIPTVLGEVLTHRLLFSDPAQEAIAARRVYDDLYSQTVQIESGVPAGIKTFLQDMGHTLQEDGDFGAVSITSKTNETLQTRNDQRIDGAISILDQRN